MINVTKKAITDLALELPLSIILIPFCLEIKSATTEVIAQKTQTPVVAKLTQCEMDALHT